MINIDFEKCTGCGACINSCPINAIVMKTDKFGFSYPLVLENCINCRACEFACPIDKSVFYPKGIAYAYQNNDYNILNRSTSGGAFYSLAKEIINREGIVYGCAYDDNLNVYHKRILDCQELIKLQGSKYVQSNIGLIYRLVLKDLKAEKWVLFSGTPCQVAGLRTYLDKDYDNLICIDIICHGVPSQQSFDKYLLWLEKSLNGKINNVAFRDKKHRGWSSSGIIYYEKNLKKLMKSLEPSQNFYYHAFLEGSISRDSCYYCKYASIKRVGDISLGDFWGVEKELTNISKGGYSLVIVNSEKGRLLTNCSMNLKYKISLENAANYNNQLRSPTIKPNNRDDIINIFQLNDVINIEKQYRNIYKKQLIVSRIKELIPVFIKDQIKKLK